MNRKKTFAVIDIVCIGGLIASFAFYFASQQTMSSWLAKNDFMVYEQDFSWAGGNSTQYMFWNVTGLNGELADIHLVSHGINVTDGKVSFPRGDVTLTINVTSREVMSSNELIDSLPVSTNEMPLGSKWPFWIPTTVKVGDPIETSYGNGFINPSQAINALNETHNCWLVLYVYSRGNNMDRFYDTSTGICLSIQSHVVSNGITVTVNETATKQISNCLKTNFQF